MGLPNTIDPVVFAATLGFILLIALIAVCAPAWRATRVDPIRTLRAG